MSARRGLKRRSVREAQLVRMIWISATLLQKRVVTFRAYATRWGSSERSYWRDIARLRRAGFLIDTTDDRQGIVGRTTVEYYAFDVEVAS